MTRALLALIVVTAAVGTEVTTARHVTHGTVLVPVASREPELRAARSFRRPPLTGWRRALRDPVWAHGRQRWHNWRAVAACESSGHWDDNTGNSYYGGLQENEAFWRNYGGLAFARRPDLATEAEQISVAERGLAAQGVGAWPACGHHLQDAA